VRGDDSRMCSSMLCDVLECPLDVLAQHLVGMAMEGGWTRDSAVAAIRALGCRLAGR
jgi:Lhr-like helicase